MELAKKHCVPCEGGIPPMSAEEENKCLKEVPKWQIDRSGGHRIKREFKFRDFNQAMDFVGRVARLAESEGHHPDMHIFYNKVRLELYTHAIGGLSESDFIMAARADMILNHK